MVVKRQLLIIDCVGVVFMKIANILVSLLFVFSLGLAVVPQEAHAIKIFGICLFEENCNGEKPAPSPTPTPTPEPTPTPTPSMTPLVEDEDGQVLGEDDSLPSTGPRENMAMIIGGIAVAFIAHKYWRTHN